MSRETLFSVFLLILLQNYAESVTFPGPNDGPKIAVLEFKKKMNVFDSDLITEIERFDLRGRGAHAALEFNYRAQEIYFSELFSNQIYRLKADGGNQNQTLLADYEGLESPEGLAYDWVHNNLYVCLWGGGHIDVIKPDSGETMVLLNTTKPRDIEVDPRTGWLYYIAGWEETARLIRCGLNGQNAENLTDQIERPSSLSLDYAENRLYWTEKYPVNKIYSIDVNGGNQQLFYKSGSSYNFSPYFLTVSRDYIYWTTGFTSRVFRREKHNGNQNQRINALEVYGRFQIQKNIFMGILSIDPLKQPDSVSLCGENNGGCSHFCLPSPVDLNLSPSFTCYCPTGRDLGDDLKTCMQ